MAPNEGDNSTATTAGADGPGTLAPPSPEQRASVPPPVESAAELPPTIGQLLDADLSAVIVLELDGNIRTINKVAVQLLGANSVDELAPGMASHALLRSFLDHVPQRLFTDPNGGTWSGDFDHTSTAGDSLVYRATVTVRHDASEPGGGYAAIIAHDVTGYRIEATRLRHRAAHDPLTGLANRRQVLGILRNAIHDQRGRPGHVGALFIDLDRLKYVNDALGHPVGDRLLVSTAGRLSEAVRPADHVARIGGDEFLVVCQNLPDAVTALDLAERIRRALTGRLRVKQLDLDFSVSIGIALSDPELFEYNDADAASALISHADTAMYEAKRSGRGRCTLFTTQMRSMARERTEMAAALSRAITDQQLTVEYQPVFSAVSQTAIGAEVLVRWQHPTLGRIDPATFVSVAEESGTIGRLGEFVLRKSIGDMRLWMDQQMIPDDFAIHANVSQMQLASSSFVNKVIELLRTYRVRPNQLILEAREAALMGGNIDVQRTIRALRRVGVRLAIDNFGTGPNALSVLTDVGADVLKLDGSLALPSGSSDADTRLVRALVLLAHALDMQVVAERVSGSEQLRRLRAAGCDYLQGNLLGSPAAFDRFDPLVSF